MSSRFIGQLELDSHLLKVLAEFLNFLHTFHLDFEIEVAVADVLGGFGQVLDRAADSRYKPEAEDDAGDDKDANHAEEGIDQQDLDFVGKVHDVDAVDREEALPLKHRDAEHEEEGQRDRHEYDDEECDENASAEFHGAS